MPRSSPWCVYTFTRSSGVRFTCVVAFALVISFAVAAKAQDHGDSTSPSVTVLDPRRYELAGFPIIGGNSDIGLQFGGVHRTAAGYRNREKVRPAREINFARTGNGQ